jgi:hypothetical protein
VTDEYTVPVCRVHHRHLHGYDDEASWWAGLASIPCSWPRELWRQSHSTPIGYIAAIASVTDLEPAAERSIRVRTRCRVHTRDTFGYLMFVGVPTRERAPFGRALGDWRRQSPGGTAKA